ncbi:MAG: AAA family ATPase, partial [SAR324 cluster bacterium]|nr:AAA family ATPase [SAR324 cluster bacterium]
MTHKRKLPIGLSDFKELIEQSYTYVDKSLLIQEVLECGDKVLLLPRPRRFGKTLNLSMLRYFFEKTEPANTALFAGLAIEQYPELMARQGQYPVIYLTFKDVKEKTWEGCLSHVHLLLSAEFSRHQEQVQPLSLKPEEEHILESVKNSVSSTIHLEASLALLMALLRRSCGQKVIVLIDEYDAPIHAGWQYGYYEDVVL